METTIIKLEPTDEKGQVTVSTGTDFEEAFGDYSELRGKGRARRQNRRVERKENKTERKLTKITGKQAVKQARKGGRQEARIERRATRKERRQEMRTGQQGARMERRGNRLDMRQGRKEATQTRRDTRTMGKLGREDAQVMSEQGRMNYEAENEAYRDSLMPEEQMDTNQGYDNQGYDNQGYDNQGYDNQGYDQGYDNQGQESGGSYAPEMGYQPITSGGGSDEQYYEEEDMGYNQPIQDEQYYEEDLEDYDEPSFQNEEYYPENDEYSQEENEFYDEGSSFNAESKDGATVVSPDVKDICNRIAWNEKFVKVILVPRRTEILKKGAPAVGIQKQIDEKVARVQELKASLDAYANADGTPAEKQKRKKEIASAMRKYSTKRPSKRPVHGGCETPVDSDLNPDFKPNKIVVPAESKSGFDDVDDFDYDTQTENGRPIIFEDSNVENYKDYLGDDEATPRIYELKSNASGESTSINWKSIIIGVAVGATLLYVAKKAKLIK